MTCRRLIWSLECVRAARFLTAAIRPYLGAPRKWQSPSSWAMEAMPGAAPKAPVGAECCVWGGLRQD